jgi:dihydrofolate reductase
MKVYVLTHSTEKPPRKNVQYIHGDLTEFVSALKQQNGSNIWIFGGASVSNILINANLIDQYIIGFIPVIVGNGVRLFEDGNPLTRLHMKECTVTDGIVMAVYER